MTGVVVPATVQPGHGIASNLIPVGLPWPAEPGTLNLASDIDVDIPGGPDGHVWPWPDGPAPWRHGVLDGERVAVLGACAPLREGWSLEVFAPVHLRSRLGLADGDRVHLVVCR